MKKKKINKCENIKISLEMLGKLIRIVRNIVLQTYLAAREHLHPEVVMQMFQDTEFSGSFYRLEKTDACVYA